MNRMKLWALVALLGACKPGAKGDQAGGTSGTPTKAATVTGFQTPESVLWDSAQDVYYVSNINGNPGEKDGNGYISVIDSSGTVKYTIKGLDAPKGMVLTPNWLWVTDIDMIRSFDPGNGAPGARVPIPGAVFLNDIAVGPDGALYITDTAIRFGSQGAEHVGTDRIFRVTEGYLRVSVALQTDSLARPNGITWDAANQRFIVVPFGGNSLLAWKPGETTVTKLATGPGQFDGVEITRDGATWVSSWADSSVYRYASGQGTNAIKGVPSPADIGYDARRNRLLVPIFTGNRVEIWQLQ